MLRIINRRSNELAEENKALGIYEDIREMPSWDTCIKEFQSISSRYDDKAFKRVRHFLLDERPEGKYLHLHFVNIDGQDRTIVEIKAPGYRLLSYSGLSNALSGAVGNIPPFVTIVLSLIAIVVSVIALSQTT
jgi:hypothetical protein